MKVDFLLTDSEIDDIVECKDLAIEQLLFRIMRHTKNHQKSNFFQKGTQQNTKKIVEAKKQNFGKKEDEKGQSSGRQEQLIRDLTDTVSMLEQKLTKMTEMMMVKDQKIKHLTEQLEKIQNQ